MAKKAEQVEQEKLKDDTMKVKLLVDTSIYDPSSGVSIGSAHFLSGTPVEVPFNSFFNKKVDEKVLEIVK